MAYRIPIVDGEPDLDYPIRHRFTLLAV